MDSSSQISKSILSWQAMGRTARVEEDFIRVFTYNFSKLKSENNIFLIDDPEAYLNRDFFRNEIQITWSDPEDTYSTKLEKYFCRVWQSVETSISFYKEIKTSRFEELTTKLEELQRELKKAPNFGIIQKISQLLSELYSLTNHYITKRQAYLKATLRKIVIAYTRNLRAIIRRLKQFLYKNIDDEDYSELLFKLNVSTLFTVKFYYHEIQRKSTNRFKLRYLF